MTAPQRPPTAIFGIPVEDLTMDETLDAIDALVRDGRESGRSHQVATVNVDFLVNAVGDERLRRLLQSTALNVADGLPLVWGSKLAGLPVRERVAGADLVPLMAAESERRGWSIHFFGSAPHVMEEALDLLGRRHPGAQLSGESGPVLSDVADVDDEVLDQIARRKADILCLALGNPKQEWFIAANAARLGVPVMIGIGGSLDMLVGERKRAPEWAQRSGAEWIFRAAQEPRRLGKRYARDAVVFGPRVARYALELRRAGDRDAVLTDAAGVVVVAESVGRLPANSVSYAEALARISDGSSTLRVDVGDAALSAKSLMMLIGLVRRAQALDCLIDFVAPAGEFRAQLDRLELLSWFDSTAGRRTP